MQFTAQKRLFLKHSCLGFFEDLAAGDGAEDLTAREDDHFPFARFKVDGAVDDGPLL